jgi:hypothetical protein
VSTMRCRRKECPLSIVPIRTVDLRGPSTSGYSVVLAALSVADVSECVVVGRRGRTPMRNPSARSCGRVPAIFVAIVTIGALSACGGKTASSPTTQPTTAAPQSTASVVTTAAAVTTVPTTASPTTRASLVLPTVPTTVDPAAQEKAIRAGWAAAHAAYKETLSALPTFDTSKLKATFVDPQLKFTTASIQVLVDKGWRRRPGPQPDTQVVEKVQIVDDTHATVSECTFSDAVIYDPNIGPDGTPGTEVIVNDKLELRRLDRIMVLDGGVWKFSDVKNPVLTEAENSCPKS